MEGLREAYAGYDRDDLARALVATMDVFEDFERETAAPLDFVPPPNRGPVRDLVRTVVGD